MRAFGQARTAKLLAIVDRGSTVSTIQPGLLGSLADSLTSCLSRDALLPALADLTATESVLVVKLDVAQFHDINSGFGYDLGDLLLKEIVSRLGLLGATLVARLGSDQFALAFTIDDPNDVLIKVKQLAQILHPRYDLPGAGLTVRFAIGYALGAAGCDGLGLARQAGAALAQSKTSQMLEPHAFEIDSEQQARRRVRLAADLQYGVSANEFLYHYQPKVDLLTGALVGVEALLRWNHGVFGMQSPDRFVALAEQTGLILDIGAKGMYAVAEFAVRVNRNRLRPLCFSINVSVVEFTHRNIVAFVAQLIQDTGVEPGWLTLELTESLFVSESDSMLRVFKSLRDLGVGLSIDDFGTGYSSLRYVERFPVTEIKIDRSFVGDLQHKAVNRIIISSVIELGAALKIDVVAEGVETEAERALLESMDCPLGQGYLFARPLTEQALLAFAHD